MQILLKNVSKKFGNHEVLKNVNIKFDKGKIYDKMIQIKFGGVVWF